MLSGRAALEDEDVAAAERRLQDAVQQFPVEPAAFLLYATAAERQGHLDNARRALIQYEALIDEDPDFVARATRIATLSVRMDDVETAAEWTRRGLRKDSENAQLLAIAKRLDDQPKAGKD